MAIQSRIQLKEDTARNWYVNNITPLNGELIIYAPGEDWPDNTKTYYTARLKIGDGETPVNSLPFIDSGSVNGKIIEEVVQMFDSYSEFPVSGDSHNQDASQQSLYVDKATKNIYYWNGLTYVKLGGVTYTPTSEQISAIDQWTRGTAPSISITNHTLIFNPGTTANLSRREVTVITSLTSG